MTCTLLPQTLHFVTIISSLEKAFESINLVSLSLYSKSSRCSLLSRLSFFFFSFKSRLSFTNGVIYFSAKVKILEKILTQIECANFTRVWYAFNPPFHKGKRIYVTRKGKGRLLFGAKSQRIEAEMYVCNFEISIPIFFLNVTLIWIVYSRFKLHLGFKRVESWKKSIYGF